MRRVWRVAEWVFLPTVALLVALVIAPDRAALATHIWLLVMLALAFLALLRIVDAAYPSRTLPVSRKPHAGAGTRATSHLSRSRRA